MSAAHIVFVLFVLCKGIAANWSYSTVATTTDGRPCLGDCSGTCIIDWPGNRMDCLNEEVNSVAPRYRTAQYKDKDHGQCLSNCGYFGWEYEWCLTAVSGWKWDFCNSGDKHVTAYKDPCKETCEKHGTGYFWCHTNGGSWEYCAPPRERKV